MAEIVQFGDAVALVIDDDEIRVGAAGDAFTVHLKGVRPGFRRLELVPVGIALAVETAADHGRQLNHLRLARVVVRLDLECHRGVNDQQRHRVGGHTAGCRLKLEAGQRAGRRRRQHAVTGWMLEEAIRPEREQIGRRR